jgi:pimeloyl-ACP methyl ester carboxylesterase
MFINLENHKAHLYVHNELENSSGTILLIPGAGMDYRMGMMINLNNLYSNFNVLSVDLPGHGFTSGPLKYTIEELSDFCISIILNLEIDNLILIGHSMGGLVALDISSKINNNMTILMNTSYPLQVGEQLLQHAKNNLDQAGEFLTKYGTFNIPEVTLKAGVFGSLGASFYNKVNGEIQSPYGTKNISEDPQREVNLYPLKKIFNQIQKEILFHDLKACSVYKNNNVKNIKGLKFIYGGRDKLARFNPDNELHANFNDEDSKIMDDTGHFPYFERPKELSSILEKFIIGNYEK